MLTRTRSTLVIVGVAATLLGLAPAASAGGSGSGERADRRIAEKGLVRASDVPDDWESTPSDDVGDSSDISECEDLDEANADAAERPFAESPDFVDPDDPNETTQVENAVFVFPNARGAKRFLGAYQDEATFDCMSAIAQAIAESFDGTESESGAATLDVDGVGDDAVGYRLDAEASDGTDRIAIEVNIIAVRVGRAIIGFGAQAGSEDVPDADEILDATVRRLERAL